MKAAKNTNITMPSRNFVVSSAPNNALLRVMFALARLGKSAVRRAAIVSGFQLVDGPSGSAAINNDANLLVAVSLGNPAKLLASCQGSRFSRASAEMTLSIIPLPSSAIGANRKLSNSDPRAVTHTERVITTFEFLRRDSDPQN